MMREFHLTCAGIAIAAILSTISCGKSQTDVGQSAPAAGAIDTARLAPSAVPIAADSAVAQRDTVPAITSTVIISTSLGDISVDLYGKDAPRTVENFVGLAQKNFYDGIAFHRVVQDYIIQAGDPNSRDASKRELWGSGGESIFGPAFADELDPSTPSGRIGYVAGTLAMANRGPNTNSSQFFIVLNDNVKQRLPYNYTIFGRVHSGMEVVHKIEQTGGKGEMPASPAIIKTIRVRKTS